ncbi:uroporphyrinogen-III C-methyltransferase [Immundisolibacter sp.]|uniref:uroporphyrinogen-III C-methyltransferase n=1 Tax=Immundisolibacter sp. TaxID=1934948 RepID=UPI00356B59EA
MPTDTTTKPEASATPGDVAEARPKPKSGRRAGWFILALLLVLGLASAVVAVWRPLQVTLTTQAATQARLTSQLEALSTWQATASDDLSALEGRSRGLAARINQLGPERLTQWALAEADYLLRTAQRAAQLDYDPARAALALDLANATLAPVSGSDSLRASIDALRAQLRSLTIPDTSALAEELAQATKILQTAPLREPGVLPSEARPPGWRGALQHAWQQLGDVIVLQRVGSPVQPLLRPQEAQYLRQQFALKLASAEYALRRRDTTAAQSDLGDLEAWASAYLDTSEPAVADALATVRRLAGLELRPPLPDLSGPQEQLATLRRTTAADRLP